MLARGTGEAAEEAVGLRWEARGGVFDPFRDILFGVEI
jgi:hypothetical protein